MQADFEPMRFTKSKPQIETMNHNIKKMGRRVKKKEKSLDLSEKIGLKTSIHFNEQGSSGSITLYYSDLDQLDDIMKRLKK